MRFLVLAPTTGSTTTKRNSHSDTRRLGPHSKALSNIATQRSVSKKVSCKMTKQLLLACTSISAFSTRCRLRLFCSFRLMPLVPLMRSLIDIDDCESATSRQALQELQNINL